MSLYTEFLADPQAIPLWIAELYPLDVDTEVEQTLRVATDEYATEPSETPANTPYTDAVLIEGPNYETDAVPAGTLGQLPPGRGGELRLGVRMGDIDAWRAYAWSGRRAVVRHGGYSPRLGMRLPYADMGVAEYEIERAKFGLDTATLQLRDPARKFDDPLQTRRYMGTDFTLRTDSSTYVAYGTPAKCDITGALTIEARIFVESLAASNQMLSWNNSGAAGYPFHFFVFTDGTLRFRASNYSAVSTAAALSIKRWYHVQVTRSGATITFRILEEATGAETIETATAGAATGTANSGGSLAWGGVGGVRFVGISEEVRLWNYARTADEWRDTRGRELTSTEAASSALKLYCRRNDATGTTDTDASGSPANGTITGGGGTWLPSLQGKADLAGKVLPDAFGYVEDANPVLVYEPTRIYQVHSRNSNGSFTVSEGGSTITAGTTYTDWAAFLAATTTAAQVDTLSCTDGTFIRLGSNPSKPISVTFQGDATGSGYVSTAADIVRRIITTRGKAPLADPGDLDTTSYSDLNTANSSVIGLYFTGETTITEALKRALGSVGAVGWFQRTTGKHRVKRFAGATGSSVVTLTEKEIISIEPGDAEQPVWEEILSYRPNYSPMSVEQMAAGSISTARQAFLEKPFREIPRTAARTKRIHQFARTERIQTYLTTEAAGVAEADRRLALFNEEAQAYRLEVNAVGLQLDRMDIVTLDFKDLDAAGAEQTRLGLSAVDFVVLATGERSAEGKALLTVWRQAFVAAAFP